VGTLFAFARESVLDDGVRREVIERVRAGNVRILTDVRASPTGFPF